MKKKLKLINAFYFICLSLFILFLSWCNKEKNIDIEVKSDNNKVNDIFQEPVQQVNNNENFVKAVETSNTGALEENINSPISEEKVENNIYENKRYNYQITYPRNWYILKEVAENDFSERWELKNLVWWDLTISNYNMIEKSKDWPYSPQKNEVSIDLVVFKINNNTTIEDFMISKEIKNMYIPFDHEKRKQEEIVINWKKAISISGVQIDPPYLPVSHVFIKNNENMFVFTYTEWNITDEIRSELKDIIKSIIIKV